jgi:DNA-binding CsgD family transcriptional regulator
MCRLVDGSVLTPTECEMLALMAGGCCSDKEIAAERGVTTHTVHHQMVLLRAKFGFAHRVKIAFWARDNGYGPQAKAARK